MAETAEFGAGDFVGAGIVDVNQEGDFHAGDDVLLGAELADEEVVDDVAAMQEELNVAPGGYAKGGGGAVVEAGGVAGVDAGGVALGVVDEIAGSFAEFIVGTGVTETPGKLVGVDLDRFLIGFRFRDGGPAAVAEEGECDEEEEGGGGPGYFEFGGGVLDGLRAAAQDDPGEQKLHSNKNDAEDEEVGGELSIVGDGDRVDGGGEPQGFGCEETNSSDGEQNE